MTSRLLSCAADTAGCAVLVVAGTLGLCLPCPLIQAAGLGLVLFAVACMAEERMRWHREEHDREMARSQAARDLACAAFGLPFVEEDV